MQNTTPQKTNEETNARTRATPPQRSAPSKTGTSRTATSAVVEAQRERVDRYHLARGEDLSDVGERQRANESKLFADSRMPTDDIEPLMTYILSDGWWTPAKFSTGKFIELWIAWKAEGKPLSKPSPRRASTPRDHEAVDRELAELEQQMASTPQPVQQLYGVFAPGGKLANRDLFATNLVTDAAFTVRTGNGGYES